MTSLMKRSILIVDDNRTNLALMDMLVRKLPGCTTQLYSDPVALAAALDTIEFDIAVFDVQMPGLDGISLTRQVRAIPRLSDKPIVIVTVDHDSDVKQSALAAGAVEFLHKPIEPVEFRTRIANLARLSDAERSLSSQREWIWNKHRTNANTARLDEEEIIGIVARAAGYKDRETPMHASRVACYCAIIAHHMGQDEEACAAIRLAAPLHDIGKVGLKDEVLQKRGFLTREERRHMTEHTRIGHALLSSSSSPVLALAAEIALNHHERWDGAGYPNGLKGHEIPLPGRIAAVAHVFDALTSVRSYKGAWTINNAMNYLQEHAGEQFDPACVAAFQNAKDEVAAVMASMSDQAMAQETDAA